MSAKIINLHDTEIVRTPIVVEPTPKVEVALQRCPVLPINWRGSLPHTPNSLIGLSNEYIELQSQIYRQAVSSGTFGGSNRITFEAFLTTRLMSSHEGDLI